MAKRTRKRDRERPAGPPPWERTGTYLLVLAGLLAVGWGLRLAFLSADPPGTLSWSQGPFTDGAVVVQNARNKVISGEWITDYTKDMYLFPLSNLAVYPVFLIAGVGRWQAAFPNTAFAILSILAMGAGLSAALGKRQGLLWVLLAALSYFLIMFQRIPLAEPAMVFLMCLSFWFFSVRERWRWAPAACGFFAASAPLFGKAHAYYFPLVLLAALWLTGTREGERRTGAALPLLGMAGAGVIWLAVLFIPHAGHIGSHIAHESYEKHVGGLFGFIKEWLQNLIGMGTYTKLFQREPVACTLGFFGLVGLLARGRAAWKEENPAVVFAALWALAGWIAISLVRMPAPRYLTALFFPLLALAVLALDALGRGGPLVLRMPRSAAGRLAGAALLFFALYQPLSAAGTPALQVLKNSTWGIGIYNLFVQEEQYSELVFFCSVLSIILTLLLLAFLFGRGAEKPLRISLSPGSGKALAAAIVAVSLLINAGSWYGWAAKRTYYLRDASRDLPDWLSPGARLMGSYAPTLGLDNELPVFSYFGEIGETDVFRRHGITHVVVVSQGDHAEVKEKYPEVFESWEMVLSYPLRCRYSDTMGIFRLPAEANGERIHEYEPSLFERAVDIAKQQRWGRALQLLQQYTREKPGNADGHYLVGFMYNELGEREEAIQAIRRAIDLRPQRPYYYFKLGEIYADLGRTGEAKRALAIANRLNPRDRDVKEALERVSPRAH
ncbi:MAG: tetratricopeptide repeat protein [Candidatus Eisenbacteria bacterium]